MDRRRLLSEQSEGRLDAILAPVRALRLRYVPLLTIYFAQGAAGLAGIAQAFWVK